MSEITTTVSSIPLLRHRDTVQTPEDQNDFVTKYEITNDHLSNNTVSEINNIGSEMNTVATEVNDNAVAAASSESNASASEDAAALSETNAENAKIAAEAALDEFDDKYLGSKASDPILDNDGNPLQSGATYYNTTSDDWKVYDLELVQWIVVSYTPTAHGSLSGLADPNIHPISAITDLQTALDDKLDDSQVTNNLTSTSTTDPLGAGQGKILQDNKIEADDYASPTEGGTVKTRLSGTDFYIRNDGTDA